MAVTTEESESFLRYNATSPPGYRVSARSTGPKESAGWWYWYNFYKNRVTKEEVHTRRKFVIDSQKAPAFRIRCEKTDEIGALIRLTNSYCLLHCQEDAKNFLNTVKGDLYYMPVINTTVAGCRMVGRMCVGNSKGLLLPDTVYDTELEQIKNELPDSVKVEKLEGRLSALGNVIACNDKVALVHPDIEKDSEQIIADTLQVEVFRHLISNNPLVGSYCIFNNHGGLIMPGVSKTELENLSSLIQLPLVAGTVNWGSKVVASGMVVNDRITYAGMKTTAHEFDIIEDIFF